MIGQGQWNCRARTDTAGVVVSTDDAGHSHTLSTVLTRPAPRPRGHRRRRSPRPGQPPPPTSCASWASPILFLDSICSGHLTKRKVAAVLACDLQHYKSRKSWIKMVVSYVFP